MLAFSYTVWLPQICKVRYAFLYQTPGKGNELLKIHLFGQRLDGPAEMLAFSHAFNCLRLGKLEKPLASKINSIKQMLCEAAEMLALCHCSVDSTS